MPFLIIFVIIPILEITAFIHIGGAIGVWPTLAIALLTAVIGGSIIKYQGFITTENIRTAISQGKTPIPELFDGLCLVASGALLITPGFVTDTIGFALLIPPVREIMRVHLAKGFKAKPDVNNPSQSHQRPDSGVIEGDYERLDDEDKS